MGKLSLRQLFGANAYQNSEHLVISKQDFINLSAADINTGETLLLAIILKAWDNFEGKLVDSNNNPIINEQGVPITYSNSASHDLLNIYYWKKQFLTIKAEPKIIDTLIIESNAVK